MYLCIYVCICVTLDMSPPLWYFQKLKKKYKKDFFNTRKNHIFIYSPFNTAMKLCIEFKNRRQSILQIIKKIFILFNIDIIFLKKKNNNDTCTMKLIKANVQIEILRGN